MLHCTGAHMGQKSMSDSMNFAFQVTEQSDWVQGKELELSTKAGSGLKCWTISPAPTSKFKNWDWIYMG